MKEAGEILRAHYRNLAIEVIEKSDRSPVTAADLAVDAFLSPALEKLSGFPVISEEREIPYAERRDWKTFWLLDPLDGTKDFIARNGEFSIALALIEDGAPTLGVIHGPVTDELYFGARGSRGSEAWLETGGKRAKLPMTRDSRVCAQSRFHHTASVEGFAREHGLTLEPCGSALKFGRVAAGRYRAYPRFGRASEWDIAAGVAIVGAAGGAVRASGAELAWNTEDLRAPAFFAWGPGHEPTT